MADTGSAQRGFRGFAAQFERRYRMAVPTLVARIALADGEWLAALWRARSIAGHDAAALALLTSFEADIARVLAVDPPAWPNPRPRTVVRTDVEPRELAALSPQQRALVSGAGSAAASIPTRRVVDELLAAGFATRDESARAAALRVRLCGHALPEAMRAAWWGDGLRPPDAVVPGAHRGAIAALSSAFGSGVAAPIDPDVCRPMDEHAALDLLLCGASLRAGIRARAGVGVDDATRRDAAA
jgi:hypothetical protein